MNAKAHVYNDKGQYYVVDVTQMDEKNTCIIYKIFAPNRFLLTDFIIKICPPIISTIHQTISSKIFGMIIVKFYFPFP